MRKLPLFVCPRCGARCLRTNRAIADYLARLERDGCQEPVFAPEEMPAGARRLWQAAPEEGAAWAWFGGAYCRWGLLERLPPPDREFYRLNPGFARLQQSPERVLFMDRKGPFRCPRCGKKLDSLYESAE